MGFGCYPSAITLASTWIRYTNHPDLLHLAATGYPMHQSSRADTTRCAFHIVIEQAGLGAEFQFPDERDAARCMLLALHRMGVVFTWRGFFSAVDHHRVLAHAMLDLEPSATQLDFNDPSFDLPLLMRAPRATTATIRRVLDRMTDRALEQPIHARQARLIEHAVTATITGDNAIVALLLRRALPDGTGVQLGDQQTVIRLGDHLQEKHEEYVRGRGCHPYSCWPATVREKLIDAFQARDRYCSELFGVLADALAESGIERIPQLVSLVEHYILLTSPDRDFYGRAAKRLRVS